MKVYDLVVLGGGSAGLVAAAGAAHLGARVLLIEKKALGGDCLYTGCVPSKALIRSARFANEARHAEALGFASSPLHFMDDDFASITRRVRRVIEQVGEHDAPERFEKMGVEILFGTPRLISPHLIEVVPREGGKTQTIKAKRFCIATGSHPRVPDIEGLRAAKFLTNENIFEVTKLPRTLAVIGGGAIGLELGQAFARFGSRVRIIHQGSCLLEKEDEEVSNFIERVMRAENIGVELNSQVTRVRVAGEQKILSVEHQDTTREIVADEILVATGRLANLEGLNLKAAGVGFDEHRIITDEYLRTTQKHIFAAGDITGHFQFTHTAAYEASVVVRNAFLFFPFMQKLDFRVIPWTTFTDPEVARVGLTEAQAREKYAADMRVYRTEYTENDRAHAEEATHGFAKIICRGRKNEIIGAHIVGASAGELIHEIVLAMKERLSISDLGSMMHVYPTLAQVTQQAGLNAVLDNLARLRKPLSYYFKLWR
ncbi:MAG: FAD-dependent oxidoreductase [Pyrinomonadaceae bacterium MAG19_C2-C3]|nr:FAD-dependent oxidoreductase [Pyrinomonadaceae bacterium MAG19_C2-C3]